MLDVIKKFDSGTLRGLTLAFIPLLVLIGALFGLDEAVFRATLEGWAEKIIAIAAAAGVAWAFVERLLKPTPPLTETAARATDEMLKAQGKTVTDAGGNVVAGVGVPSTIATNLAMNPQKGFAKLPMLLAISLVSALTACATLGIPQAKSFNDRIAIAYSGVTAVREAAIVYHDKMIAKAAAETDETRRQALRTVLENDLENIQEHADKVREGLDIARSLRDVDFKSAENRLEAMMKSLEALQQYLK